MNQRSQIAYFREKQRFSQWWIWVIILGIAVVLLVAMFQQFILGDPFGENPAPDLMLLIFGIVFGILFPWLFWSLTLITEVRQEGVFVRFFPLHWHGKLIPYEKIESFYMREYHPIREYGGWGIRFGPSGTAYNVSGNQGLQLVFADGK